MPPPDMPEKLLFASAEIFQIDSASIFFQFPSGFRFLNFQVSQFFRVHKFSGFSTSLFRNFFITATSRFAKNNELYKTQNSSICPGIKICQHSERLLAVSENATKSAPAIFRRTFRVRCIQPART
jgi:hypothetical protein